MWGRCNSPGSHAAALLALLSAACGEPDADACEPVARVAALTNGAERSGLLALGPEEEAAVVRLTLTLGQPEGAAIEHCSGVLLTSSWVVSARHCVGDSPLERAQVSVGPHADAPALVREARLIVHPELDLALLELAEPVASADALPLAPLFELDEDAWLGQRVELGGYGVDEGGRSGTRRFTTVSIARFGDTRLWVDGEGRTGACKGDSGGPALVRDAAGHPRVLGVLSAGSQSCLGQDVYTRLDVARDWIEQHVGELERPLSAPCGAIDEAGICLYSRAHVCDGGVLTVRSCDPETPCGWDPTAGAYGCLALPGCEGLDQLGTCEGAVARVCRRGEAVETDCGSCGLACAPAASGLVGCRRGPAHDAGAPASP